MAELLGREFFAPKDREFLKEAFADLTQDVTLTIVRKPPSRIILLDQKQGEVGDDGGELVTAVMRELASTSTRVKVEEIDDTREPERTNTLSW